MPESSEDEIRALEDLASPIGAFVRERCVVDPNESVLVRSLYVAFREWCEAEGHSPSASNVLARSLKGLIPTMTRQGRAETRRYRGLGLRDE
jgi:putative DNA primase/helicase